MKIAPVMQRAVVGTPLAADAARATIVVDGLRGNY
jgi:hypothetical protein